MVRKLLLLACVAAGALSATAAMACGHYGPAEGRQYDPAAFVRMMHEPYDSRAQVPMIVAHRGVWGEINGRENIPENSMQAITKAGEMHMEAVELDVHNAGRKINEYSLVLMHDYTVGRTTDAGKGRHGWDPTWGGVNSEFVDRGEIDQLRVYRDREHRAIDQTKTLALREFNLDLRELTPDRVEAMKLYAFHKSSAADLGEFTVSGSVHQAFGAYVPTSERVPSLVTALKYIGIHYPGMTVIVDLRHRDEVLAAMDTIDKVSDCYGRPGAQWIILKPFANIFPGGWDLDRQGPSVMNTYGQRARKYLWIPVMSNRLVREGTAGEPSHIPGYGPDQSKLTVPTLQYFQNWERAGTNLAGTELGNLGGLQTVRDHQQRELHWRNMTSWRPSDLRSDDDQYGFNWKDDGLGIYRTGISTMDATERDSGAVIAEDVHLYLQGLQRSPDKLQQRRQMLEQISFEARD